MSGASPKFIVTESVRMSDKVLAGYVNNEPVSVFGYCPNIIWMLGTPSIKKAPVRLMKQSLDFIAEGLECYDRLGNYIDVRNVITINWLKRLGFVFGPPVRIGYENRFFRYAYVTKGTLKNV